MSSATILLAEDDDQLRAFMALTLEQAGFTVAAVADGTQALAAVEERRPDLLLLDILLPSRSGLEVLKTIRQQSTVPIIMVTAVDEDQDKVAALDLGADDYLTKPFGVPELLARVRAVLRRSSWREQPADRPLLRFGTIEIDQDLRAVTRSGELVPLTPTEYNLLLELVTNPRRVLTHRVLLQRVWGPEYGEEPEYLRVYISRLRRKLEADPSRPRHLITEPGVGYRFEPQPS